jgi:hypothetical protein
VELHNEELHNPFSSPSVISIIKPRMSRECSTNGRKIIEYSILVERQKE